jgi:hypothetical protein
MTANIQLPSKQVADVLVATFPFQDQMAFGELINGAIVTVTLYTGTDPNPSAILSGIPNYVSSGGLSVAQTLVSGVSGNVYLLVCTVSTTLGNTFANQGYLAVINATDMF